MEYERNREARIINMNQKSYIEEVLKCYNVEKYNLVGTLIDVNLKLLKFLYEEFENVQRKLKGIPYKA